MDLVAPFWNFLRPIKGLSERVVLVCIRSIRFISCVSATHCEFDWAQSCSLPCSLTIALPISVESNIIKGWSAEMFYLTNVWYSPAESHGLQIVDWSGLCGLKALESFRDKAWQDDMNAMKLLEINKSWTTFCWFLLSFFVFDFVFWPLDDFFVFDSARNVHCNALPREVQTMGWQGAGDLLSCNIYVIKMW